MFEVGVASGAAELAVKGFFEPLKAVAFGSDEAGPLADAESLDGLADVFVADADAGDVEGLDFAGAFVGDGAFEPDEAAGLGEDAVTVGKAQSGSI